MTAARLPQLGSVVWAEVADANGICKVRPAVVVTATANIVEAGTLQVLAITTRLSVPLPEDYVLLPWKRQGKVRSGLRRKCDAVTSWQSEIAVCAVQQVVGILPPEVIKELLARILPNNPPGSPAPENVDEASTRPPTLPK